MTEQTPKARRDLRHQCPWYAAEHEARNARYARPGKRQHREHNFDLRPFGAAGASLYAASKQAVEGLTKSAALEAVSSGVCVNMVAPGPIETGRLNRFTGTDERKAPLAANVPLKRTGRREEVAQTMVFLASDKASFITSASYLVDGGKTAR